MLYHCRTMDSAWPMQRHWPRYWFKNDISMFFFPLFTHISQLKKFFVKNTGCIPLYEFHFTHEIMEFIITMKLKRKKKWNETHYLLQIIVFENDIFLFVKFLFNSITREIAICFYSSIYLFSLSIYKYNTMGFVIIIIKKKKFITKFFIVLFFFQLKITIYY